MTDDKGTMPRPDNETIPPGFSRRSGSRPLLEQLEELGLPSRLGTPRAPKRRLPR